MFFLFLTVVIFVMIAIYWYYSQNLSQLKCPECASRLSKSAKACSMCGWTSRRVSPEQALSICRFTILEAHRRQVIDEESLQRANVLLERLRESLAEDHRTTINPDHAPGNLGPPLLASDSPEVPIIAEILKDTQHSVIISNAETVGTENVAGQSDTVAPSRIIQDSGIPHPLEAVYEDRSVQKIVKSKILWSDWLNAFMEEKNIQWGELVGGLLIVCCSTALVVSFWSHIASRPWLKFLLFTGVNAATLGLGLNAWYRWKLPTTSKGILFIGLLLLPLNYLAFAIFTLGIPLDFATAVGEGISLLGLGTLAWFSSRILFPQACVLATILSVGFAFSNLLIRRFVTNEVNPFELYVVALVLLSFYVLSLLAGWNLTWHGKSSNEIDQRSSQETRIADVFRLLALGSFGFLLAVGLLLGCTQRVFDSLHTLSPLATVAAFPGLLYSDGVLRILRRGDRRYLGILGIVSASITIAVAGLILAWPTPAWLALSLSGLAGLSIFGLTRYRNPLLTQIIYGVVCLIVLVFSHALSGRIAWNEEDPWIAWRTFLSSMTGFVLIGCSTALLGWSIFLNRIPGEFPGRATLRTAWYIGVVGLWFVAVFGLGRHEYAMSVSFVFLAYGIALIVFGTVRGSTYHDAVAGFFIFIASFQAICFGWLVEESWSVSGFWASALAAAVLFTSVAARDSFIQHPKKEIDWLLGWSKLAMACATIACTSWFIQKDWLCLESISPLSTRNWIVLAAIWAVGACLLRSESYGSMFQILGAWAGSYSIFSYCKEQTWYSSVPIGCLHPVCVMYELIWLAVICSAMMLLRKGLDATAARTNEFAPTKYGLCGSAWNTLDAIHSDRIARFVAALAGVLTIVLCIYSCVPGAMQELSSSRSGSTQSISYSFRNETIDREIPALTRFVLPNFSHAYFQLVNRDPASMWLGLPLVFWMWMTSGIAGILSGWKDRGKLAYGLAMSVLVAILFCFASRWEQDIAVASVTRWLFAGYFMAVCTWLGLAHVRIRNATHSLEIDQKSISQAAHLREVTDCILGVAILQIVAVNALLASIVVIESLARRTYTIFDSVVWIALSLICLIGLALLAQSYWGQRLLSERESKTRFNEYSTVVVSIAAVLITPLLAWSVLQIVLGLIGFPITGPNSSSMFARIGLAPSYAIPILGIAVGLLIVAFSLPSAGMAVATSQVLCVAAIIAYLLILKSNGLHPGSWIGLAALLSALDGIFLFCWLLYRHLRPNRMEAPGWSQGFDDKQKWWQICLHHMAFGFLLVGLTGGFILSLYTAGAAKYLLWAALSMTVSWIVLIGTSRLSQIRTDSALWMLSLGSILSTTGVSLGFGPNISLAIGSVLLIGTAGIAVERARLSNRWTWLWCFMSANGMAILFALRELANANGNWWCIGLLVLSTLVSLAMVWRSQRLRFAIPAFCTANFAGLVYCVQLSPNRTSYEFASSTFLQQIAISLALCISIHICGHKYRIRKLTNLNVCLLLMMSMGWFCMSLARDVPAFHWSYYSTTIVLSLVASLLGFLRPRLSDVNWMTYLSALSIPILFLQWIDPIPSDLPWLASLVFAAFCLASSYLVRAGDRVRRTMNRFEWFSEIEQGPPSDIVVVSNTCMAILVSCLGIAAQFQCEWQALRFASSLAIMAAGISVGMLARYRENSITERLSDAGETRATLALRMIALWMEAIALLAFGWHFFEPHSSLVLDRASVCGFTFIITAMVYGFGLVKWMGLREEWQHAAVRIMPYLVGVSILCILGCLSIESKTEAIGIVPIVLLQFTLLLTLVACLTSALLKGRDPLDLTEKGKTFYVYIAEVLVVLWVVHVRLSIPWMFQGLVQRVWPLLIVILAFAGLMASEWANRFRLKVLSVPLRRTGSLLPLLPAIAHWAMPSSIHYSVSLICGAFAYATYAFVRKSSTYWVASVVFANWGLWYLLQENSLSFAKNPQFWIVPPALCVIVLIQFGKQNMTRGQMAAGRYVATSAIYISSTTELFMRGIADAPWMPIVLAVLSILGILFGIGARIRAMLWLGMIFLLVALFSIVWHAAVDLEQTWVWYACGLVIGILMLTIFALFEKRREHLNRIVSSLQTWEE